MPLKKSQGNMYDWVTHMHTHLGGECSHKCIYCYVGRNRWGRAERYKGLPRLLQHELKVDYGKGKTIFIEHMQDMFSKDIESEWIQAILNHCDTYAGSNYVFQTKNPYRAYAFFDNFPSSYMIGTTIETNRDSGVSQAPLPETRYNGLGCFRARGIKIFVTIEPIMDFDVNILVEWIRNLKPSFVNIGSDSKQSNLEEPPREKVIELIRELQSFTMIKRKTNLARLIGKD